MQWLWSLEEHQQVHVEWKNVWRSCVPQKLNISFGYVVATVFLLAKDSNKKVFQSLVAVYFLILRATPMGVAKKRCQMSFCNPEQCFGTHKQCFCSNGRCQNGMSF